MRRIFNLATTCLLCSLLAACRDFSTELVIIKNYAESYEPEVRLETDKELRKYQVPPFSFVSQPDNKVLDTISSLNASGRRDHEKYIILIFLRHYRAQLNLASQSYELRARDEFTEKPKNLLLKEFLRLIDLKPEGREFISSSEAAAWVATHPSLKEYPPIAVEVKRIENAEKELLDRSK